jgi:hypothetical protein
MLASTRWESRRRFMVPSGCGWELDRDRARGWYDVIENRDIVAIVEVRIITGGGGKGRKGKARTGGPCCAWRGPAPASANLKEAAYQVAPVRACPDKARWAAANPMRCPGSCSNINCVTSSLSYGHSLALLSCRRQPCRVRLIVQNGYCLSRTIITLLILSLFSAPKSGRGYLSLLWSPLLAMHPDRLSHHLHSFDKSHVALRVSFCACR